MDNNIRKHIKSNVEKEHLNKCFLDYGFVNKINEIQVDYDADIVPEDPMACALFKVKFLCTLCRPLITSTIVGKAQGITPIMIYIVCGPLDIIVKTSTNINKDIFMFNPKLNTWTAKVSQQYMILKEGTHLKVKILNKKIIDKTQRILCTGYLENLASEKEIEQSIKDSFMGESYLSFEEYLQKEKAIIETEEEKQLQKNLLESKLQLTESEKSDSNDSVNIAESNNSDNEERSENSDTE
jgi:DNA-directed RNA polymerase subunit E'/Rpb7